MKNALILEFANIHKKYGQTPVLRDVSFEVGEGEFLSLLGPSGSGKTTCLRIIAGFEYADSGKLTIGGTDNLSVPPNERPVNTVFQDYALFPNMTVKENVAYGPMVKGVSKEQRFKEAAQYMELMRISEFADRKPAQLSGGQRQRVALARAIINRPRVLLLDEPLSALDQKLREEMQSELKRLQKELGIAFIYVTHDQQEALSMSDRVCLLNDGKLEQIGTPSEVYEKPKTVFVADFLGKANIVSADFAPELSELKGLSAIRGEKIRVEEEIDPSENTTSLGKISLTCDVEDTLYQGSRWLWICRTATGKKLYAMGHTINAANKKLVDGKWKVRLVWDLADMINLSDSSAAVSLNDQKSKTKEAN